MAGARRKNLVRSYVLLAAAAALKKKEFFLNTMCGRRFLNWLQLRKKLLKILLNIDWKISKLD